MIRFRLFFLSLILLIILAADICAQENFVIRKIGISGNDSLRKEVLLKQMNTKARALNKKLNFWEKGNRFNQFIFEEDIIRLKKYYQKNGFLEAEIKYDLLANKKNNKLNILINVSQGNAVHIDNISLILMNDSANSDLIDSIKEVLPLKPLFRFQDENIIFSEKIIRDIFATRGYPFVTVERDIVLKQQSYAADIQFKVNPGRRSYYGKIDVWGDSLISKSLINKHIEIKEGDVFSQKKLEETQEELFDMALFRYVTIRPSMDSVKNDKVPILIQLKELPRWSVKAGVGYGSEDRIRVSLLLTQLNFLGGGRNFIFKGQHSYFIPINIEAKFIQPDIWLKDLDFILNPFFSREREDSYEVDRLGTSATLQKAFNKKTGVYVSYSYGKDKVDLINTDLLLPFEDLDNLNRTKSGMTLGFNRSTADNLFSPTKGWKIDGRATYMGIGFKSTYQYYKLMAEVNYYHSLWPDVIIATKLKSGVIKPIKGDLFAPIEDRFLIGGSQSLRGWGRNQISPLNLAGDKLGGSSMLEVSAELRFPIKSVFSGVMFMDIGNVWLESWDFNLPELHYDFGLGLRVKTPVGPIRLDLATPIVNEEFNAQFFITIGHAF